MKLQAGNVRRERACRGEVYDEDGNILRPQRGKKGPIRQV